MGNSICRIVQMYNREWGLSTEDYPGNPMSKLLSSSGPGQVPGPRTNDKDLDMGYTLNCQAQVQVAFFLRETKRAKLKIPVTGKLLRSLLV